MGGLLAYLFTRAPTKFGIQYAAHVGYAVTAEVLGSFFLAFLYLTQTEEKTKLSKDPAITTLIIAAAYLAALLMVSGPSEYLACLNPAVAFGASFEQTYSGSAGGWKRAYVYLPMPFIGAIAAVFFHEFVYKRVSATIQESEEDNSSDVLGDGNDGLLDQKE